MDSIKFFNRDAVYGEFSNLAEFPIEIAGEEWPTVEHYYQAEKFVDKEYREKIRMTACVREAIKLGRSREVRMRSDWKELKLDIMKKAIHAKYTQHQNLKELLLSTGEAVLIEHTEKDSFWGDGGDGSGQNRLGILLMELRSQLINK